MANLTESPIYESGIFQLEKSTPALGGPPVIDAGIPSAGHANAQAQQLANRTAYLKQQLDDGGSATNLATNLADKTVPTKGAALVGFSQPGDTAALLSVRDKIGEILSPQDYTSLSGAFGRAIAQGLVIEVRQSITVRIPSDAPTLQIALDHISVAVSQVRITLLIESGHTPSTSVYLHDGDYSNFRITSESSPVTISPLLARIDLFHGFNAKMPTLACLVDAGGYGMNGIFLEANSTMTIESGCGIKNAYNTGLLAQSGSTACAKGSNFTYAARNGNTGAGITSWSAVVDATDADVSFSGYYGAQAAHSGMLTFERGKANDCYRYGVRGSDRGNIDFSEGQASRCGVYGLYAFQNSDINAPDATVEGCGSANVVASNASTINFRGGKANGATKSAPVGSASNYGNNIMAISGSTIEAFYGQAKSAADTGIYCEGAGSSVNFGGGDASNCIARGIYCTQSGTVAAQLGKTNACGIGVYVELGGDFSGPSMQLKDCTTSAMVLNDGGKVSVPLAVATGGATHGLRVLNGSIANIRGANFQRGALEDPTDIQCFSGSQIAAAGAIGGLNRTANAITAQGVIYK